MNRQDIERLSNMEIEIKNMNHKIDEHCQNQRADFDKVFTKLDNLENKFAAKWVEKLSIGLLISVLASIITFVITNLRG